MPYHEKISVGFLLSRYPILYSIRISNQEYQIPPSRYLALENCISHHPAHPSGPSGYAKFYRIPSRWPNFPTRIALFCKLPPACISVAQFFTGMCPRCVLMAELLKMVMKKLKSKGIKIRSWCEAFVNRFNRN